ncbi:class I SAM-dependent methyltransferase [Amycolatopsis dongchuanensis]|uniref:Class I SAM-dependent methyltransferase n=1 Tax=Amycolatopsis dongchuanensis TaxID=1070866 RepID=A0ABP9QZB9_9PSEU
MPTLPQQPHEAREIAESFGGDPERYDRTRQPYPEALVERVVAASPGREFLDVGCGTGIEARQFQAAGCRVLGVEPDARMAGFARQRGLEVEVAKFEDWDPAGRSFDALVAGTSWHWVDPVAGAAKAARVLRPGGRVALFWHVFDLPEPVRQAFVAVYERVVPDSPFDVRKLPKRAMDVYRPGLDRTAEKLRNTGAFGEPERWLFDWQRTYTREEWLDQLPTHGMFTRLPPEKLAEVTQAVGAAIDELGGDLTMPYTTAVVTAVRD